MSKWPPVGTRVRISSSTGLFAHEYPVGTVVGVEMRDAVCVVRHDNGTTTSWSYPDSLELAWQPAHGELVVLLGKVSSTGTGPMTPMARQIGRVGRVTHDDPAALAHGYVHVDTGMAGARVSERWVWRVSHLRPVRAEVVSLYERGFALRNQAWDDRCPSCTRIEEWLETLCYFESEMERLAAQ
jgi:hypothetical protein